VEENFKIIYSVTVNFVKIGSLKPIIYLKNKVKNKVHPPRGGIEV
jgi:hypothetical protein